MLWILMPRLRLDLRFLFILASPCFYGAPSSDQISPSPSKFASFSGCHSRSFPACGWLWSGEIFSVAAAASCSSGRRLDHAS